MNLILCLVAASILVNVAKSGKTVEQETEETRKALEEIKGRWESMKQNVSDHPQLEHNFNSAVTDAAKIIETLNNSLKIFREQRLEKERNAHAGNSADEVNVMKKTPKGTLTSLTEKLQEIIYKLGALKSEAESNSIYLQEIIFASEDAEYLSKALNDALKVEDKDIEIKTLINLVDALSAAIKLVGIRTDSAKIPEKAEEVQESAFSTVEECSATLKDLQAYLSKTLDHKTLEANKISEINKNKERLKLVQEKLREVVTTLDALMHHTITISSIPVALKGGAQLKIVIKNFIRSNHNADISAYKLNNALKAIMNAKVTSYEDAKMNLNRLALELYWMVFNVGKYTKATKSPEKGKELQQSAYRTVGELKTTLNGIHISSRTDLD